MTWSGVHIGDDHPFFRSPTELEIDASAHDDDIRSCDGRISRHWKPSGARVRRKGQSYTENLGAGGLKRLSRHRLPMPAIERTKSKRPAIDAKRRPIGKPTDRRDQIVH